MHLRPAARALALATALLLAPATAAGAGAAAPLPASTTASEDAAVDDARLVLLLDASRSMEDPDADGSPKIEAARSALHAVIDDLDPQQSVGLRVFGGDVELDRPMSELCTDSRLVVPIGTGNADELRDAVEGYAPRGETPIAYALQQAAEDLGDEGQRTILLVSDGVATCDPDPCEVAEELGADGLDLVVHTVGLGADAATRDQLQCIAGATGGQYADAADTDTLTTALTRISTRAFRPFTIAGTPVEGTLDVADAPEVGAGQYTDTMAEDQDRAKHYLVRRELAGSILHVGVTMRPAGGGGTSAYNLRLETREGDFCGVGLGTPWSAGGSNSFGTGATSSAGAGVGYDADDECSTDEELVLTVYPQGGSEPIVGEPFEMVVIEEPPVTNIEELPGRSPLPEWEGLEPGEPAGDVVAGSSLNDAPLLEPGETYSSELTRGEIVFFRVPVEHGQRLEALLEVAEPTGLLAETTGPVSDIADIELVGPNRERARSSLADTGDLRSRAILRADRASRAVATTYEVRWANHPDGNENGASLAGDYFVAVSLTSNNEMLLPVPFTVTTALRGEVSGVPEYGEAPAGADVADEEAATSSPEPEAAESEAPAESTGGAATAPELDEEATSRTLALLLGALGVVVLLAGVLVIAIRRRPPE